MHASARNMAKSLTNLRRSAGARRQVARTTGAVSEPEAARAGFREAGARMHARRRLQRREAAGVPDKFLTLIQLGSWLLNWRRSPAGPALTQSLT